MEKTEPNTENTETIEANYHRIKDFVIDFNRRFMIPEERQIFTATKNTLLYPALEYRDVMEEIV